MPAQAPVFDVGSKGLGGVLNAPRIAHHMLAQGRGPDTAGMAFKQRKAKGGFKVGQHFCRGRLRGVDQPRGLVQNQGLAQRGEKLEVLEPQAIDQARQHIRICCERIACGLGNEVFHALFAGGDCPGFGLALIPGIFLRYSFFLCLLINL